MRPLRFAALLLAAASAATASSAAEPAKPDLGHYIDISSTALPIIWQGRLVNYVFVKLRLTLAPNLDSADYRSKEPYFRDALVRIGYRTPFNAATDLVHVDEAAIRRTMLAEAIHIAGPRVVIGVAVLSQNPQRVSGLPRPLAARNAPG